MYGGAITGELYKFMAPDYTEKKLLLKRSTWALSMAFNKVDQTFYMADPYIGLLSFQLDENDNVINETILIHINFPNQVSVGPDGMVYVTDSFSRNNRVYTKMDNFYHEMFSGAATGQLYKYDPFQKTSTLLIPADSHSLRIANGVAVSSDNKYVYVGGLLNEAVARYSLERQEMENLDWLPTHGMPDNLVVRDEGLYGAIAVPRTSISDMLFHSNWPRRILPRLPLPGFGDDPCLIFFVPNNASEPSKYIKVEGMPACNCVVPHSDGFIYTSSYLLEGAIGRFKNPFLD
jgi:hypothetical protein